jgi:hypothetical protein
MPQWTGPADIGVDNLPNLGGSGTQAYRVSNAINTYLPGTVCGYTAVDSQVYPDFQTVQPLAAGTTTPLVAGVVADYWGGFDDAGVNPTSYVSVALQTNVQGTPYVRLKIKGINYVWVDQSGTGAVTITNGIPLVSSRNTAGYAQGVALATATAESAYIGTANLPLTPTYGYTLTAASLAQATQTFTVAGTPASGDVLTVTIQAPYTAAQPGTAQTYAVSVTLNSTTAASATTAATALAAALNASQYFATGSYFGQGGYFTASSSAGVVTVTVNTLANNFLVTGGTTSGAGNTQEQYQFWIGISGMVANSLTTAASVSSGAGSTLTAGGSTFSGGTGYKGRVPCLVNGAY